MSRHERRIVRATVTFVPATEARVQRLFTGMQPSCSIGDDLVACVVVRADGEDAFEFGGTYEVVITLPYGSVYDELLVAGLPIRLQYGGRVLGRGQITSVDTM